MTSSASANSAIPQGNLSGFDIPTPSALHDQVRELNKCNDDLRDVAIEYFINHVLISAKKNLMEELLNAKNIEKSSKLTAVLFDSARLNQKYIEVDRREKHAVFSSKLSDIGFQCFEIRELIKENNRLLSTLENTLNHRGYRVMCETYPERNVCISVEWDNPEYHNTQ